MAHRTLLTAAVAALLAACTGGGASTPPPAAAGRAEPAFLERAREMGLDFVHANGMTGRHLEAEIMQEQLAKRAVVEMDLSGGIALPDGTTKVRAFVGNRGTRVLRDYNWEFFCPVAIFDLVNIKFHGSSLDPEPQALEGNQVLCRCMSGHSTIPVYPERVHELGLIVLKGTIPNGTQLRFFWKIISEDGVFPEDAMWGELTIPLIDTSLTPSAPSLQTEAALRGSRMTRMPDMSSRKSGRGLVGVLCLRQSATNVRSMSNPMRGFATSSALPLPDVDETLTVAKWKCTLRPRPPRS